MLKIKHGIAKNIVMEVEHEISVNQLNKEQGECVKLFYLEGKSYQEVAELTSYSIKKVKSYIQNGKRNLKNILTKAGISALTIVFIIFI